MARVTLSPFLGKRVQQALDDGRFDVVHIHEPLVPMLPIEFLRRSDTLTIGTFHAAHDRGSWGYSLMRHPLRRFASRLDGRIAVSPAAARFMLRYFPGDYEIIPNGIDFERFATPAPCPPEIQRLQPYVLFVGRFEERKGLSTLLKAFAQLRTARADVNLVVIGDGAGRAHHETWVASRRIGGVQFTGRVSDDVLPTYYQNAAVFCAPNTGNESFGIVLLEALAAGCPVVASNIEGFAELVVYGAHGLLVPPGRPAALADALSRILADESLRSSLASRGSEYAARFAWPRVARTVLDYYSFATSR
jgi:phosphatidylinositol alpha-mannosyltransferase